MAVLFSELVQDVYTITKRADLVGRTALAVQAATLKAHQSDDYEPDLIEQSILFDTPDYYQSLDYKSVFPLWRKARYIRASDSTGAAGPLLTKIEPEKVVDDYNASRINVWYQAGAYVQIRTLEQKQYFFIGYYANPNVTEASYSSWVADSHKFAIVYEAAAIVFKTIGQDQESAAYRTMVAEQIAMIKMHNITNIG
jgi:hypothetical protein